MATILDSKEFDVSWLHGVDFEKVKEWIDSIDFGREDCILKIMFTRGGRITRNKKSFTKGKLDFLLSKENAVKVWRKPNYNFDFVKRKFLWKGKVQHITSGEALCLYRWLVLNETPDREQYFFLYNMRRRLGTEFLSEIEKIKAKEERDSYYADA